MHKLKTVTTSEIEQIREEIAAELVGLRFGKIFQLDRSSIAIDFFPHSGRYLFISFGPKAGAAFLIRRRLKTLEREAVHPTPFAIDLKNRLGSAELLAVSRVQGSRALKLDLKKSDGAVAQVVVQLGSDRPNVFVLDGDETIVLSGRNSDLLGQRVGDKYAAPDVKDTVDGPSRDTAGESLSDILDAKYRERRS